eukprot:2531873-Prymnesium_polylepis.1
MSERIVSISAAAAIVGTREARRRAALRLATELGTPLTSGTKWPGTPSLPTPPRALPRHWRAATPRPSARA